MPPGGSEKLLCRSEINSAGFIAIRIVYFSVLSLTQEERQQQKRKIRFSLVFVVRDFLSEKRNFFIRFAPNSTINFKWYLCVAAVDWPRPFMPRNNNFSSRFFSRLISHSDPRVFELNCFMDSLGGFSCRSKHKKVCRNYFALMLDLMSEFLSPLTLSRGSTHHLPKSSFNFSLDNYLFTENAHVRWTRKGPKRHV